METFREELGRAQASVSHGRASNLTQKQCRATQERAHSPLLLFRLRTQRQPEKLHRPRVAFPRSSLEAFQCSRTAALILF